MPTSTPVIALDDQFTAAMLRSNAWRGQCLHVFAKSETAVTEALATLAGVPDRGKGIKLPHLVGQRFEALAEALRPDGRFAAEGSRTRLLAAAVQQHLPVRAALSHGVGRISIDRSARWTMVLHVTGLKGHGLTRELSVIEERDGQTLLHELSTTMQQLCDAVGKLKATLAG